MTLYCYGITAGRRAAKGHIVKAFIKLVIISVCNLEIRISTALLTGQTKGWCQYLRKNRIVMVLLLCGRWTGRFWSSGFLDPRSHLLPQAFRPAAWNKQTVQKLTFFNATSFTVKHKTFWEVNTKLKHSCSQPFFFLFLSALRGSYPSFWLGKICGWTVLQRIPYIRSGSLHFRVFMGHWRQGAWWTKPRSSTVASTLAGRAESTAEVISGEVTSVWWAGWPFHSRREWNTFI